MRGRLDWDLGGSGVFTPLSGQKYYQHFVDMNKPHKIIHKAVVFEAYKQNTLKTGGG
jgi:hypothetical protein